MIVILTALEAEHAAVRAQLTGIERHDHKAGTLFEVGALAAKPERRIALAATGMGGLNAAALTERAITEFAPSTMMFVGVAGGLRDWLQLGDVVVASRVYAYHGGRSENEDFLTRPRAWDISHKADQVARWLARSNGWRRTLPDSGSVPMVHFEPVAAGDVVLNSRTSALAQQLKHNYNDAIAVEMESAGFALAGHLNESTPAVTIRAISDHAGGAKDRTDGEGWQAIAARNAAAFAVALAAELDDSPRTAQSTAENPSPPVVHNTNIARENAQVGQQIGVNNGAYNALPHPRGGW